MELELAIYFPNMKRLNEMEDALRYVNIQKVQSGLAAVMFPMDPNQAEYVANLGLAPVWDEETSQNYIEWREGTTLYQVWLEDTTSLMAKLNVMNTLDLGGVGAWRIGYGTSDAWNLLRVYAYGQ